MGFPPLIADTHKSLVKNLKTLALEDVSTEAASMVVDMTRRMVKLNVLRTFPSQYAKVAVWTTSAAAIDNGNGHMKSIHAKNVPLNTEEQKALDAPKAAAQRRGMKVSMKD